MTWLSDYEIEDLQERFDREEAPNLHKAVRGLARLVNWTNRNSDGWGYWKLPGKSAARLMDKLTAKQEEQRRSWSSGEFTDLTDKEIESLFRPIRKFLTEREVEDPDSVLFPAPPPAPVSYAPCITGTIEIGDRKSEFRLPLLSPDTDYVQWGADNYVLGSRVDLLQRMAEGAREWAEENLCRTCKERLLDDGEGYDGECGDCADRTESEGRCKECGLDSDEPGPDALCASCRDGVE